MEDLHLIYLVFFECAIAFSFISQALYFVCTPIFDSSPYLQAQSHFLSDSRLREDGLDVGYQLSGQPATLWTNQIALLLNTGDYSEI